MSLVLSGERPSAAASINPLRAILVWFTKVRAQRAQRLALETLLQLDNYRLDDLGINRGDLFDAMHASQRPTKLLADRASRRSR